MKQTIRRVFAFLSAVVLVLGPFGRPSCAQADGSRAAYASAAALQEQGLYDLAADAWRDLLAKKLDSELAPRARYNLGVCRFHSGAFVEAADLFTTVADAERFPTLAEAAWANLGLARLNAGRGLMAIPNHDPKAVERELNAAVQAFDTSVETYPNGAQTVSSRFYRGEALAMLQRHGEAAAAFRSVLTNAEATPLEREARVGLANALLELGSYDQVEAAIGKLPEDATAPLLAAEASLLRGEASLGLEQYALAADAFALSAKATDFVDAAYATERMAYSRYLLKDYQAAAAAYDSLAERFPDSPLSAPGRVSAGKCWLLANQPKEAAERLAAAWQAAPTAANADTARWWGRALLELGDAAKAVEVARTVLALTPADSQALQLLLADSLLAIEGKKREAAEAYEAYANRWPEAAASPRALLVAAKVALDLDEAERAEQLATQFLERYPDIASAVDAKVVAASAAFRRGDFPAASERYLDLSKTYADEARVAGWLMRGAEALRSQGLVQPAKAALDRLIAAYPDDPLVARARYERGRLLTDSGDLAGANEDFLAVAASASPPLEGYASFALATNQYTAGDAAASIATLDKMLATGAGEVAGAAYYLLATAQHATGQFKPALGSLKNAVASPADLQRLEALCWIRLKQAREAVAAVEKFAAQFPEQPVVAELLHELAWMHQDAGRDAEALAAFDRIGSLGEPGSFAAEAAFRAGELHSKAERHVEAANSFATAARLTAGGADVALHEQSLHLLGWAHWKKGDISEAADAFRQQLKAGAEGALATDAHLMLGECLFAHEAYAEALAAYRQGLDGVANSAELKRLALLHAGQAAGQAGDWEASLKLLERAQGELKESRLADEAAYERAWALHNLGRSAEAAPEFARLADEAAGALAARAAFMRGELHFAAQEHQQAVRMFFRVAYGFGGREAPEEYHAWQSESLFEAARCLEQLDRNDPALKLYAELVERFPESPKAKLAADRLQASGPDTGK